jgi:hypothetical protein
VTKAPARPASPAHALRSEYRRAWFFFAGLTNTLFDRSMSDSRRSDRTHENAIRTNEPRGEIPAFLQIEEE